MLHHFMIEDEVIRESGEEEIQHMDANECYYGQREELPWYVCPWPC